ncbi:MAG: type I restriction enzyme HsdR N-terminal domain-containing protein [Sulfurovum sp.]|nr:type I restriction enzyme HsdR N-terminal domain-containing protein [Sulfurovum sp.]
MQGRRADYILSVNNVDCIVVEAKKAGMALREKQVFQATSYGAYSGIKWALLTNLNQWQLYYINAGDKIEPELVFCIDLDVIRDEDVEMLFKISKNGILRKGLLDKVREKNRALSQANIISTLLTDNVLDKMRTTINKDSAYKVSNEEIQKTLESFLYL